MKYLLNLSKPELNEDGTVRVYDMPEGPTPAFEVEFEDENGIRRATAQSNLPWYWTISIANEKGAKFVS